MKPTVYQLEHSPFCIPITQALTALSVPFEVRNVPNGNRQEIIEVTNGAYYQVPVLVHGENVVFETGPESQEVARYVDREFAGSKLFPAGLQGIQEILIRYLENEVEGVTFRLVDPAYLAEIDDVVEKTMIIRHKERKFGKGCVERWAAERDALAAEAEGLLRPFDKMLAVSPFLLGETPLYSDFLLFGILGNLTYKKYNKIPAQLGNLVEWFARLKEYRFRAV